VKRAKQKVQALTLLQVEMQRYISAFSILLYSNTYPHSSLSLLSPAYGFVEDRVGVVTEARNSAGMGWVQREAGNEHELVLGVSLLFLGTEYQPSEGWC
jgi:hypothetical protein